MVQNAVFGGFTQFSIHLEIVGSEFSLPESEVGSHYKTGTGTGTRKFGFRNSEVYICNKFASQEIYALSSLQILPTHSPSLFPAYTLYFSYVQGTLQVTKLVGLSVSWMVHNARVILSH